MNSISKKIFTVFMVFGILFTINLVTVHLWANKAEKNSRAINLAGRQRMLSQKLTKELFAIAHNLNSRSDLDATVALFEKTHRGLLEGDIELGLAPQSDSKVVSQLNKVGTYWNELKSLISSMQSGSVEIADKIYIQSIVVLKEMNKAVGMIEENAADVGFLKSMVMAIFLFSFVIAALVYLYIIKNLIKPVREMTEKTSLLSNGNFTADIKIKVSDEIGIMAQNFNRMKNVISAIIKKIYASTDNLASNTEELSATTGQINSGIDSQTKLTEQSATAVTEISQTIMDVAKNASDASTSAKESVEVAAEAKKAVEDTVSGMLSIAQRVEESASTIEELGKSSKQIGEIISVIEDIADQTNLLALNAAIEAARAGEQGRGFAVVADEVRKLAERTGKATGEISEMIKKIQKDTEISVKSMGDGKEKVEEGVKLAEEAKVSLDKILSASERGFDMVQMIATATEEQSAAIDEVSSSMENVSEISKSSQMSVSQINTATEDLASLANELRELVSWFKIEPATSTSTKHGDHQKKQIDYSQETEEAIMPEHETAGSISFGNGGN